MARRATHFKTARENPNTVIIGGGNEFAPPGTEADRDPQAVANLKKAYDLLSYDIFALSPSDAKVLEHTRVPRSSTWTGPVARPEVLTRQSQDGLLAFVVFPDSGQPDPDMEKELIRVATSLRDTTKYNLIIGISTWGASRETAFIEKREPVFDVILGSGEGPGYAGLYLRDNRVLWVRAFTKGKNVHSVTFPALPAPGVKAVWNPEVSAFTRSAPLGDAVASAPEIEAIFNP